jgi:hypothetical protein
MGLAPSACAQGKRLPLMTPSLVRDFYTVSEMADLLRIRPGTVRNRLWRRDHSLPPSAVIGRRRLFPVSAYDVWKQRVVIQSA